MYKTLRLQHCFTCIISGPTGSGKSTFCIRFLQNLKTLYTESIFRGGIIVCYSEKTAVPHVQLSRIDKTSSFTKGCQGTLLTRRVNHVSLTLMNN
jgi:pantothenate kinase-related protein Tda10